MTKPRHASMHRAVVARRGPDVFGAGVEGDVFVNRSHGYPSFVAFILRCDEASLEGWMQAKVLVAIPSRRRAGAAPQDDDGTRGARQVQTASTLLPSGSIRNAA